MTDVENGPLARACLRLAKAEVELRAAKMALETQAARFRGVVPVRATARETGLSGCTVSDFFRGRLKVSAANALRLARIAEQFEVRT